jgi:hypothetical protein
MRDMDWSSLVNNLDSWSLKDYRTTRRGLLLIIYKTMCETDSIAPVQFQPAARHNVYDDGITEVAGKHIVIPLKITPEGNQRPGNIAK